MDSGTHLATSIIVHFEPPLPFAPPQKGNAPPEQAVHPLKPFSIKTQYLFQSSSGALVPEPFLQQLLHIDRGVKMAILYFSDVLHKVGLDPARVKLIRHSLRDKGFKQCYDENLVYEYTCHQKNNFSKGYDYWVVFVSDSSTFPTQK